MILDKFMNGGYDYDNFVELVKENADAHYVIDTVPEIMGSNLIYAKIFNVFYQRTPDSEENIIELPHYSYEAYENRFVKLLFMLLGYDQGLGDSYYIHDERIHTINEKNLDDFYEKIILALQEWARVTVLLPQLKIAIRLADGLFFDCVILENYELVEKMVITEGLYIAKAGYNY